MRYLFDCCVDGCIRTIYKYRESNLNCVSISHILQIHIYSLIVWIDAIHSESLKQSLNKQIINTNKIRACYLPSSSPSTLIYPRKTWCPVRMVHSCYFNVQNCAIYIAQSNERKQLCSEKGQRGKRSHHYNWHPSDWKNHGPFRSE